VFAELYEKARPFITWLQEVRHNVVVYTRAVVDDVLDFRPRKKRRDSIAIAALVSRGVRSASRCVLTW
jgi:hypothetical protein